MSDASGTSAVIDRVLRDHPDVAAELHAVHDAAWAAADPELLELCRLRVAMLLGNQPELDARTSGAVSDGRKIEHLAQWPTAGCFTERDRACLAFTEAFVIDVASLDDATAQRAAAALGPEHFNDFVHALLVVEQRQRLRLAWGRLFQGTAS